MNPIIDIANAVVERIQEAYPELNVSRHYNPKIQLEKLGPTIINVSPFSAAIEPNDRGRRKYNIVIDVYVLAKIHSGSDEEIDPLMQLVNDISLLFEHFEPDVGNGSTCIQIENKPIYSRGMIDENRQFSSRLALTFIVLEVIR